LGQKEEKLVMMHPQPGKENQKHLTGEAQALDPVCGMTVAVEGAHETTVHGGVTYHFCHAGCRQRFEAAPERYLSTA